MNEDLKESLNENIKRFELYESKKDSRDATNILNQELNLLYKTKYKIIKDKNKIYISSINLEKNLIREIDLLNNEYSKNVLYKIINKHDVINDQLKSELFDIKISLDDTDLYTYMKILFNF